MASRVVVLFFAALASCHGDSLPVHPYEKQISGWADVVDRDEGGVPVRIRRRRDEATMVLVRGGEFFLGTEPLTGPPRPPTSGPPLPHEGESPRQRVRLTSDFFLDIDEVSVARYREFCRLTSRSAPQLDVARSPRDFPISELTWLDALEYAKWAQCSLPTSAQFERARWLGITEDERKEVPVQLSEPVRLVAIERLPLDRLGLRGMGGSVQEWCLDVYVPYPLSGRAAPTGTVGGDVVVVDPMVLGQVAPPLPHEARVVRGAVRSHEVRYPWLRSLRPPGVRGPGFRCAYTCM